MIGARLMLLSALAVLSACEGSKQPEKIIKAPFRARLGSQEISVPIRDDFENAYLQKSPRPLFSFVSIIVCRHDSAGPQPPGCEEFQELPIHANGITVYLRPQAGSSFRWLRERPAAPAPDSKPLVPLPVFIPVLTSVGSGPNEEYQLSRIQNSTAKPSLVTTDQNWPIAACSKDPNTKTGYCNIGFLIGGLNVEAYYSTGSKAEVTQSDIWRVASALDRKIRSVIAS